MLVVVGSTLRSAVWARYDGRRWVSGRWPADQSAFFVAGWGDTVVVPLGRSMGNGVDASPLAAVAVSRDAGLTWEVRTAPSGTIEALDAVVMPDGTAFVSAAVGGLLRLRPSGDLGVVPGITPASLGTQGPRLYALTPAERGHHVSRLRVSADDGDTWTRVPLPGRER